jgi:hypothetical protein
MRQRVEQTLAIVAVALVLACVGTTGFSPVGDFVPWPASPLWLGVISVVCGILLALVGEQALRSMVAASLLGVLIFGGLWSHIAWVLVGQYLSANFLELVLSNLVLTYVFQRGALMLLISLLPGLLGVAIASIFLPDR